MSVTASDDRCVQTKNDTPDTKPIKDTEIQNVRIKTLQPWTGNRNFQFVPVGGFIREDRTAGVPTDQRDFSMCCLSDNLRVVCGMLVFTDSGQEPSSVLLWLLWRRVVRSAQQLWLDDAGVLLFVFCFFAEVDPKNKSITFSQQIYLCEETYAQQMFFFPCK